MALFNPAIGVYKEIGFEEAKKQIQRDEEQENDSDTE